MVAVLSTMVPLGTPAPDFALADVRDGRLVRRADLAGQPLLAMFLCNHCPFVLHIRPRLIEMAHLWRQQGLAMAAISSNDPGTHPQDSAAAMAAVAHDLALPFPYLFDADQQVAIAFRAACTPDFFLYDRDHRLAYRGRFCAARPGGAAATGDDLSAAVTAVLTGQAPPAVQTPSIGCNIKWRPGAEPPWFPC